MIFISYRRGEDAGFAGRLYDRLERTFRRRLFMDVDSIAPGEDFVAVLEARVAECDVLLALIGRGWLTATDDAGQRRLDDPEDFVRIEVGAALAQGKRVIPVLIDDALMPRVDQLPDDLKPLARRQATRLSHERFRGDSDRLIRVLKPVLAPPPASKGVGPPPSPGAEAPPSPASGRGSVTPASERPAEEKQPLPPAMAEPLPPGEVGALAPGGGDVTPLHSLSRERERAGVRAAAAPNPEPKNGVYISIDPRELPDLAVFKDIDAPWCPEMVILPKGSFLMGSPETEEERYDDEGPQHEVTIGVRFGIGRYPVTFEEYDHFCAATGRDKPADQGWGRNRRPVINVSWNDAVAYAEWLAGRTGQRYRLPSEAEWEYACRAGTTTRYAFGDGISDKDANFDRKIGKTTEVGAYPANRWGLHDMHGNVWEWIEDVWHDSYAGAPSDGSAWTDGEGKDSSRERVSRGGSWGILPRFLRSAYRGRYPPDRRLYLLGFRVARTLS